MIATIRTVPATTDCFMVTPPIRQRSVPKRSGKSFGSAPKTMCPPPFSTSRMPSVAMKSAISDCPTSRRSTKRSIASPSSAMPAAVTRSAIHRSTPAVIIVIIASVAIISISPCAMLKTRPER